VKNMGEEEEEEGEEGGEEEEEAAEDMTVGVLCASPCVLTRAHRRERERGEGRGWMA
jgi:hypothetical protein